MLTAAPACTSRRVLQNDSLPEQLVADAIGFGEVARFSRRVARTDQLLDRLVEILLMVGKDIEHWMYAQHRGAQSFGVSGRDSTGVDGDVRVADEREERAECAGGVQIVIHGRLEIRQKAADELIGV